MEGGAEVKNTPTLETDAFCTSFKSTDDPRGEKQWVPAPFARKLVRELEQARAYSDKLAAGLPIGMLPKDVENLRDANAHFAQQVFGLEKEITEAWHILSVLSSNLLDDGPTWPRALKWLDKNEKFRPENKLIENFHSKQKQ